MTCLLTTKCVAPRDQGTVVRCHHSWTSRLYHAWILVCSTISVPGKSWPVRATLQTMYHWSDDLRQCWSKCDPTYACSPLSQLGIGVEWSMPRKQHQHVRFPSMALRWRSILVSDTGFTDGHWSRTQPGNYDRPQATGHVTISNPGLMDRCRSEYA